MAYSDTKNPFYVDDKDEFAFRPITDTGYQSSSGNNPFMDDNEFVGRPLSRYEQLQKMKDNSMNRQLESTQNALASIYDSEQMGVATAEELLQQGEQLSNTESKLDKINQDMKTSQKHLNSIKSIFGGIKNWWQGKDRLTEPSYSQKIVNQHAPSLQEALDTRMSTGVKASPHPALALKSENGWGFYEDDDDDIDRKFLGAECRNYNQKGTNEPQQKQVIRSGLVAADEKLDKNLDMMCEGMMRLKGLAKGLGEEIGKQNEQIDRITGKADRADIKLKDQNRQMRQILR